MIKNFIEGTAVISFMIGIGAMGGALDLNNSIIAPAVILLTSSIIVFLCERFSR